MWEFTVSPVTEARHTLFSSSFSGAGTPVMVECPTLPAALEDHRVEHVDVLKLDYGGSEYDVLFGCDGGTLAPVRHIVMELHESPAIPHSRRALLSFLEGHASVPSSTTSDSAPATSDVHGFFRR